jgi:FtsP/CotA-like multicopper oxidase with cupredoxin domain
MRRAGFIRAGAGTLTALALPRLSPRAQAAEVVEYRLTSGAVPFAPAPGVNFAGIGYNGTIPGPLLRVVHGQRVRVTYVNNGTAESTIHWHGMILPNDMDGVPGITQAPVRRGEQFVYEFAPNPPGTRWYHDHAGLGQVRGLFGMFVVDDPHDEKPDAEFALIFHDVPRMATVPQAIQGVSTAPMTDPLGSPEMLAMKPADRMGDEVGYSAHCINGACYPSTAPLPVKVGQRVRLRVLNANPTQTRYVRLAGHRLTVTRADGNPLAQPVTVDALRVGVAERYDAWFEVTRPGAWLLQGLSSDPLAYQQAAVVYTEGMEKASPMASPQSVEGVDFITYQKAGGTAASVAPGPPVTHAYDFTLGGGAYGSRQWTIDGRVYPNTEKIFVHHGDVVSVHFKNTTDMDHPMHLHGHVFDVIEVDGTPLARPLAKDTSLVRSYGGTMTWRFTADSPPGRWLLHCHNQIHMMDGMMTLVVYRP